MTVFEGDGTVRGFWRALKAALEAKHYDVVHAHSPHVALLFLGATLLSFRQAARSTVMTVHDSYANYKLRNRLMFLPVFAGFHRVVCCGRASYQSFPPLYKKLAGDRLGYVTNGLDVSRVDRISATVEGHATGGFTVVAVSRLVDIKNPFTALEAIRTAADPSSRLVYIGDGPLRAALVTQRREAGLEERVEFTGLIPRESVFEHLLGADLYLSTSRGEGLPISVLEAMACRRPVVLSDIPPHREIAEGAEFIPLVSPDDAAGFAREIQKFREMSAAERSRIGEQCRAVVEERFSLQAMHAGYEEVYAQVIGCPAPFLSEAHR